MNNKKIEKEKWGIILMLGLIISTLIISPAGIIIGAINFKQITRRKQCYALIIIGVIMTVLWIIHFSGHHHH